MKMTAEEKYIKKQKECDAAYVEMIEDNINKLKEKYIGHYIKYSLYPEDDSVCTSYMFVDDLFFDRFYTLINGGYDIKYDYRITFVGQYMESFFSDHEHDTFVNYYYEHETTFGLDFFSRHCDDKCITIINEYEWMNVFVKMLDNMSIYNKKKMDFNKEKHLKKDLKKD